MVIIQCDTCDFPEDAAHAPAGDDMVAQRWPGLLGSNRYVNHEYVAEGKCDVAWFLVSMQNPISI
jgi:hypothetical protein